MTTEQNNIDNMSKEELNAALLSEINELDGKEQPQPEVEEPKVEEPEEESDPKPEPKGEDGDGEEDAEGEESEKNPYKKRIDRLTRRREELKQENQKKDDLLSQKDQEIAELRKQLENPKTQRDEETTPDEEEDFDVRVKKTVDEALAKRDQEAELSKADQKELKDLFKNNPNAKEREDEILKLAERHPTLSFEAVDRILAPEDYVDPVEVNRSKAQRLSSGSRSRADLAQDPDPNKMSTNELGDYLKRQIQDGKLSV